MQPQTESNIRPEIRRYCPQCNGLDGITTGAGDIQAAGTVRFARTCPCGHRWVDTIQGGPFLQHLRQ
jgi:hypothetical protein